MKALRHENVKNVLTCWQIEDKNYTLSKKNGDKVHIIQNSILKYKVYLDAKIEFYGASRHRRTQFTASAQFFTALCFI